MHTRAVLALIALTITGNAVAGTFFSYDLNEDGVLSIEEAAFLEEVDFVIADIDGNGVLDIEEFKATLARRKLGDTNLETDVPVFDPEDAPIPNR